MAREIKHVPEHCRFETTVDGCTGFVKYRIDNEALDILHTVVPKAIEGQGVGADLVRGAYNYARDNKLKCLATCSFAVIWLKRHPEYEALPPEI